jgi:hypothetical protein
MAGTECQPVKSDQHNAFVTPPAKSRHQAGQQCTLTSHSTSVSYNQRQSLQFNGYAPGHRRGAAPARIRAGRWPCPTGSPRPDHWLQPMWRQMLTAVHPGLPQGSQSSGCEHRRAHGKWEHAGVLQATGTCWSVASHCVNSMSYSPTLHCAEYALLGCSAHLGHGRQRDEEASPDEQRNRSAQDQGHTPPVMVWQLQKAKVRA